MKPQIQKAVLYGILDLGYVTPENLLRKAADLLQGGVDLLQLRAKNQTEEDITRWGEHLRPLCKKHRVPFIINDYPAIAHKIGADGVHIGQEDGSLAEVREAVGSDLLVGRSTHSPIQAQAALEEGFDYIGYGPLYATPTKAGRPAIGLEGIREVEETVGKEIPVFCIGGIKQGNLSEVIQAGGKRAVLVSELLSSEHTREITTAVKKSIQYSRYQ